MQWLDRIERRLGWLSFPGLFRFYVLMGVMAFVLSWLRPDLAVILEFLAIPLIWNNYATAAIFSTLNARVLAERIQTESAALNQAEEEYLGA